MKHPLSLFVAMSALLVLGVGCTTASPAPQQPPTTATPTAQPVTTTKENSVLRPMPRTIPATVEVKQPASKTVSVNIQANAFSPQVIAINEGDTIEWINKDTVSHTVASDGALLWDSGNIAVGKTYKRTFKAGTYTYHCGSHPSMKGTVIVK